MRAIRKGREPASLVEYRASGGRTFDDYQDKDALREALVKEQRGICCYCMSRIHPHAGSMRIEHWHSQSGHRQEQLDYSNLLAACRGGEFGGRTHRHCDVSKGDRDLSRNPGNPSDRIEELIRFRSDGFISSPDSVLDREINEVLNLNLRFLQENRRATLSAFLQANPSGRGLASRKD